MYLYIQHNPKSQSKIPSGFFKECDKHSLKFIEKNRSPWIAMLTLKKEFKRGLSLLDCKRCSKTI